MDFKIMITEARKKQNMTQRELAEKLNVSDKTISKWETGVNFPDLKMLYQISKVLGISVSDFLTADDLKQPEPDSEKDVFIIAQFKTNQIIALILFGLSAVCIGWSLTGPVMFLASILLLGSSLIVFIISIINFRTFYEQRRDTRKFDRLSNFYSLLFFDSFFLVITIYFWTIFTYMSIRFIYLPLVLLQVVPLLLRKWILKSNDYRIKEDKFNKVMTISYWAIVFCGNLFFWILSTGWFSWDLTMHGVAILAGFTYVLWFSPLVLGLIIPLRNTYIKLD